MLRGATVTALRGVSRPVLAGNSGQTVMRTATSQSLLVGTPSSLVAPRGGVSAPVLARHYSASAVMAHHVGGSPAGGDIFSALDTFPRRHTASWTTSEVSEMVKKVGVSSVDDMVDKMVPKNIRFNRALKLASLFLWFFSHGGHG